MLNILGMLGGGGGGGILGMPMNMLGGVGQATGLNRLPILQGFFPGSGGGTSPLGPLLGGLGLGKGTGQGFVNPSILGGGLAAYRKNK